MKCLFATLVASTVLLVPFGRAVAFQDTNVNSRYRIELITIDNGTHPPSEALQRELDRLVGRPYRTETLDAVERRVRLEYPSYRVTRVVAKGGMQDHIRVRFELESTRKIIDFSSPRFSYHSQQQFTFGAGADLNFERASFNFGLITDNNERVERYSGYHGAVVAPIAHSRFKVALLGESYRTQWNRKTLMVSDALYRTRTNIEPTLIYDIARGLELRAGFSFNNLEMQFPVARDQAVNAVITTLRYSRQWQLGLTGTQTLEAGYSLRAAASFLRSDFDYRRHMGEARFTLASGNSEKSTSSLSFSSLVGAIDGSAPVLDRFVLGNTHTLRGWNRFDLAPAGADRVIHFSADGRYHFVRAVYDTGTLWNAGRPKVLRHSLGVGVVVSGITAMVAFPIRNGSMEPIFLVGMNF
ncbi:hypothetical protein [Bryobacter aggregatus]|uniref:hypothetical protein n=1 Tax=Bryobacter aggregatus TaxID=360054 RepID=UPI0004E1E32F|nr:hypothetical protein [Bryobacter aggregatus]